MRIENWPSGQSGQIRFQATSSRAVLVVREVDANGNTVFNIPTPNESQLVPFAPSIPPGCTGNLNVNPLGGKTTGLVWIYAYFGNSSTPRGQVIAANQTPPQSSSYPSKLGDKIGYFLYLDRDVSVSGSYNCSSSSATANVNISYKRGWNYLVTNVLATNGTTPTTLSTTFHTTLPSDLRWYYTLGSVTVITPQGAR